MNLKNKKLNDLGKSYFGLRVSDGAGAFVAGFIFLYIFQIILLFITNFAGVDIKNPPVWFTYVTMTINQTALVFSVFLFGLVVRKPVLQECRINKKLSAKQALIIPVISLLCIVAFMPIANGFVMLVELITKEPVANNINIGTQWWEIILSVIFVSVLPSIGEEILFRGAVAKGLKRKNYLFAIVVSGFMFSIFHGNAAQTVHQFLIGMIFAYLYFVTGSLLASMIAHFANNAFAIGLEVLTANVKITLPLWADIFVQVCMVVFGVFAIYLMLRYLMKVSKQEKNILEPNADKMAWAKDIAKAFSIKGIKDNYNRLNTSLKDLFDDECDNIDVNGDIVVSEENEKTDDSLRKMLEESNKKTIAKRKNSIICHLRQQLELHLQFG